MLRWFANFGARLSRPRDFTRYLTTETMKSFDEIDREKKVKIYELEIDMLRQEGRKAPDLEKLRPYDWEHILGLPSKSARRRYYQFLWQNEMKREAIDQKKELKKIENVERLAKHREENASNEHIVYGLNHNSLFLRIYDTTITHFHNLKLIRSMMFDQKLIIDCSYDQYMNTREASNAGKQLMLCFAENRMHDEPFDLHFCNVNLKNTSAKILNRFIPTMLDEDFPLNIHAESLTDKFDKKKLVYLTPHCNNDLVEYNHDDIYVIGAMVDKTNNEPLSLAKAKKQGLRMARLPLDRYLSWGAGSGKSLTLNQMVNIMLEMKKHGDWERALRFVPRRKIVDEQQFDRPRFNERRSFDYQQENSANRRDNRQEYFSDHRDNRQEFSPNRRDNRQEYFSDHRDNRQEFSHDRRKPYRHDYSQDRRDNRQEFSFDQRQSYRQDYSQDRRDNRQELSNNSQPYNNNRRNEFQTREKFNEREDSRRNQFNDNRKDYQPNQRNNSFDNSRSFKERKHFEKFKFNLDTWGKKMNQKKNDES